MRLSTLPSAHRGRFRSWRGCGGTRVREGRCCPSLPSEPCLRLSPHTAQADHYHPCCPIAAAPVCLFISGSVCKSTGLHLTCPSDFDSPFGSRQVVHQAHVSRLSPGQTPYPAGYRFPLPFGCWPSLLGPSFPAEELCPSCVGPTGRPPDRNGVSTFRTEEVRPGRMPSLLRNPGVLDADLPVLHPQFAIAASAIFRRQPSLTEPHRWFTRVHPSGLPLAQHGPYGSGLPWALPLAMQPFVTY